MVGKNDAEVTKVQFRTFNIPPILQTNVPGTGGADIHSPDLFLTFKQLKLISSETKTSNIFHVKLSML